MTMSDRITIQIISIERFFCAGHSVRIYPHPHSIHSGRLLFQQSARTSSPSNSAFWSEPLLNELDVLDMNVKYRCTHTPPFGLSVSGFDYQYWSGMLFRRWQRHRSCSLHNEWEIQNKTNEKKFKTQSGHSHSYPLYSTSTALHSAILRVLR